MTSSNTTRRLFSLLPALLVAIALLGSGAPTAHAGYGGSAPAAKGGASISAACAWNYSFNTSIPGTGSAVYLGGNYYIKNCGGVFLYATTMTFNTRADVYRCDNGAWLGGANITQASTSYLLTNSFLPVNTCVNIVVNKMPWQAASGYYSFAGSLGT